MSRILIVFGTKVDEILDKCEDCLMLEQDYFGTSWCMITGTPIEYPDTVPAFPPHCPLPEVPDNPKK